jgi:predicted Zn-ribbon and HTH transcriptional regulator
VTNILPFRPVQRRTASQEVPLERPDLSGVLKDGHGGSVKGSHDNLEVQAAAVEANPMRRLVRMACNGCRHEWQAPKAGRCPKCKSSKVSIRHTTSCMAQRL